MWRWKWCVDFVEGNDEDSSFKCWFLVLVSSHFLLKFIMKFSLIKKNWQNKFWNFMSSWTSILHYSISTLLIWYFPSSKSFITLQILPIPRNNIKSQTKNKLWSNCSIKIANKRSISKHLCSFFSENVLKFDHVVLKDSIVSVQKGSL